LETEGRPVRPGRCRGCGAPVVWIRTAAGRAQICDPPEQLVNLVAPAPPGSRSVVTLTTIEGGTVRGLVVPASDPRSRIVRGYTPHWARCPHRQAFTRTSK
jgi:hypothetical protein